MILNQFQFSEESVNHTIENTEDRSLQCPIPRSSRCPTDRAKGHNMGLPSDPGAGGDGRS
jgi:hypothetical protein